MVRRGGRSSGCKTCRKRKIKCDEAVPECSQCRTSGQKCPGRMEGMIFISMDEKLQKARQPSSNVAATGSSGLELSDIRPRPEIGLQLPPAAQSLVAGAAEQCFRGCFISSYHTSLVQWPSRPLQNPTSPVLKLAVRAGTMAFYGNLTKNVALQTDASRWYSKAIKLEMARLAAKVPRSRQVPKAVDPEDLLTPMIFALFESALCTSPMGWAHHLTAAARFLEDLGPEHCQIGIIHDIFRSVRLNMVYITTTTRSECAFASEEWQTLPFIGHPKSPIDELIDILLYLPCCLATETRLESLDVNINSTLRGELTRKLAEQLVLPMTALSAWWARHVTDTIKDHCISNLLTLPTTTIPSPELFNSPMEATTFAYYSTAAVMTAQLFALTAPSLKLNELIYSHARAILSAVAYHRAHGPYSEGTFVMIYPMKVMLFRSPYLDQREDIQQTLLAWGQERGVEGVCASGAPMWRRPGHVS